MSEGTGSMGMSPPPKKTDKERLEAAVAAIGKEIDKAVKVVETSKTLSEQQVDVAFRFVSHLLLTATSKAKLSIPIAQAANGGFSLDAPPPMVAPAERIVGERMVGQRNNPRTPDDDDDDVGFIEDAGPGFN